MRPSFGLILPLTICLGGCASPVEVTNMSGAVEERAPAVGEAHRRPPLARSIDLDLDTPTEDSAFLVWTRGDEHATTYRIDHVGRVIEMFDGIVVAAKGREWGWGEETVSLPTMPCELSDDAPRGPAARGTGVQASFNATKGHESQLVVDPGQDEPTDAEIEHHVEVVASVGPYVFVKESTYTSNCGVHGNVAVKSLIWDIASGAPAPMPMDLGELDGPRAAALRLFEEDTFETPTFEEGLELSEIIPKIFAAANLGVGLQFTAPACYACTRGGWSSYTKSVVVDGVKLPRMFEPFAHTPAAIRTFALTHQGTVVSGYSATR